MHVIDGFVRWWNTLAAKNGKAKFRNQREAAEFVRRVQNRNGGPNAKIIALRRAYEEANRSRSGVQTPGSRGRERESRARGIALTDLTCKAQVTVPKPGK